MENPIMELKGIVKDPVELASITFPSAGLVVVFFAYRQHIHPELSDLPDPLSGNIYGALLFLVFTLVVSLVLKRVSHDLLNCIYDRFYRDRKRKVADTWYKRLQVTIVPNDPLLNRYEEVLESLRENKNPVMAKVELLQIQSKLARSMSLIFLVFAIILAVKSNFVLLVVCAALSLLMMLYAFFKGRWDASELVYEARFQEIQANVSG